MRSKQESELALGRSSGQKRRRRRERERKECDRGRTNRGAVVREGKKSP